MAETKNEEGDIRRTHVTSNYSGVKYQVKQVYIVCPRCHNGRWANAQCVFSLAFIGLCQQCSIEVSDLAFAPYRDLNRTISLRKKVKENRREIDVFRPTIE